MKSKKKTASILSPQAVQEIQDEIFRKMSADKKIHLSSDLTMLHFKLRQFTRYPKPPKTTFENIILSMLLCQKRKGNKKHSKDIEYFLKTSRGFLRPNFLKKQAAKLGVSSLLKKFL